MSYTPKEDFYRGVVHGLAEAAVDRPELLTPRRVGKHTEEAKVLAAISAAGWFIREDRGRTPTADEVRDADALDRALRGARTEK